MRIDLHVHSKYSDRPSNWILRKLKFPESCTDPVRLYETAKQRGMSLVTITDHNAIHGCLDIAHLPDTFMSEEVSTRFPNDGCKLHILVFDIDEQRHQDIQKIRDNVFDLARYLTTEKISHAVSHPLFSLNGRLGTDHLEQMLLLFKTLELNGARDDCINKRLKLILSLVTPEHVEMLMEKYPWIHACDEPWEKNFIGGSDDHSSLSIARTYTEIEQARSRAEFFARVERGEAKVSGRPATPQTLAHTIYSIGFQHVIGKLRLEKRVNYDVVFRLLNRLLQAFPQAEKSPLAFILQYFWNVTKFFSKKTSTHTMVLSMARREIKQLIRNDPELERIAQKKVTDVGELEKKWFQFVNRLSGRMLYELNNRIVGGIRNMNPFDFFHFWTAGAVLYGFLTPCFAAFGSFAGDRTVSRKILDAFLKLKPDKRPEGAPPKVAFFVDACGGTTDPAPASLSRIETLREMRGKCTVITCDEESSAYGNGTRNFKPINASQSAKPGTMKLSYPPLLEMINYCFEENFTHIYAATTGPLGLAASFTARVLSLPLIGLYHSFSGAGLENEIDDPQTERAFSRCVAWYYDQMEWIHVTSESAAEELSQRGISRQKIRIIPGGMNVEMLHPSARDNGLNDRMRVRPGKKLLYVGEESTWENIPVLINAFESLVRSRDDVNLVIVGNGPHLHELREMMNGKPCVFSGEVKPENMASIYASCDLLLLPGNGNKKAGNLLLEAQAHGLPVVATNGEIPCADLVPGETGIIVDGNNGHRFVEAIESLLSNPAKLHSMSNAARAYGRNRAIERLCREVLKTIQV